MGTHTVQDTKPIRKTVPSFFDLINKVIEDYFTFDIFLEYYTRGIMLN